MSANYEVVREGWVFDGHRFSAGDPISLDTIEKHGRGKTGSFLRLGIIRERPRPASRKKYHLTPLEDVENPGDVGEMPGRQGTSEDVIEE